MSVVGAGLVRNNFGVLVFPGAGNFANTLLGPEATPLGLKRFGWLEEIRAGGVAPSWWWGVVFVYWIVVASI